MSSSYDKCETEILSKEDTNNNQSEKKPPLPTDSEDKLTGSLYKYRALKTVILLTSLVLLGMAYSLLGSTFVDLQQFLQVDARAISLVMPLSSCGLIAASLMAIFRLNKFSVELSMIISIISLSLITAVWTAVPSIYWYLGLSIIHGYFSCLFMCEMQPYFLQMWANHRLQKPLLLAIYGLLTLGLAIGPFLVTPFLANRSGHHGHHSAGDSRTSDESPPRASADPNDYVITTGVRDIQGNQYTNISDQLTTIDINNSTSPAPYAEYTGHVRQAFMALGLPLLIPAILYIIVCFKSGASVWRKKQEKANPHDASSAKPLPKLTKIDRNVLVMLTLTFYTFNAIAEFIPLSFFTLYVNALLGWVPPRSILINSAFNGALCVGRLMGIPLSAYLKPRTILAMNLGTVLSAASLLLMSRMHDFVVWAGAAMLGLGISTVFGTMLLWLSESLKVTDRLMAAIIISNALGGIVGPPMTGQLFVLVSPLSMAVIIFFASILTITIYVILRVLERRRRNRGALIPQEENGVKI